MKLVHTGQLTLTVFLMVCVHLPVNSQSYSANRDLKIASELISQNRETEALEHLNFFLGQHPKNTEALFMKARILSNEGQYLEALTDYNMLISLAPENSEAYYSRGVIRYHLQQYLPALDDFQKSLEIPTKGTNTAYFKMNSGKRATGISTLNTMKAEIYNYIGLCHFQLNDQSTAVLSYTRGIRSDPDNADIYVNRALSYEKSGIADSAQADYQRALQVDPAHEIAKLNLSRLQMGEEKLQSLNEFIDAYPDRPEGYADRGMYFFSHSRYEASTTDFRRALQLAPDNTTYIVDLALSEMKLQNYQSAEALLFDAIDREPENARAFFNLGNIHFQFKRYEEAISYYTLALHHDGDNASYLYNRALAYYNDNKLPQACEDMEKLLLIDPEIGMDFRRKHCLKTDSENQVSPEN
jgi:tetratricopeptide (TPR) repeat protein